jgi:ribosomal protein S18 acetylase RimI-like enzyme
VPAVWLAGPEEAETVAGLIREFRDWYGRNHPNDESVAASVQRLLGDADTDFLLAAGAEGEPAAGICALRYRHSVWMGADDCWLEDLFVRRGAQGRGLGAALVQAALDRAAARGCRRVELDVDEGNAAARALYRRLGFTEHAKTDPPERTLFIARYLELR